MGLMFTALSTIALIEIPREKMAQASGITNSVRQLGGSLGVAILATLLTSRVNYHAQQYGHALNPRSEVFQETAKNIKFHIVHDAGASVSKASGISQSIIISNMNDNKSSSSNNIIDETY